MSVFEADDCYQPSEREFLQPKLYNTFNQNNNKNDKDAAFKSKKVNPPPIRPDLKYINAEDEDQMEIYGFMPNTFKTFLTWTIIIFTFGILRLIFHWKPHWMLYCTHNQCSLEKAKKVLLIDHFMQKFTENVMHTMNDQLIYHQIGSTNSSSSSSGCSVIPKSNGQFEMVDSIIYFENKKVRYVWDNDSKEFYKVRGLDKDIKCTYFYNQKGLTALEQKQRRKIYGMNEIEVTVQTITQILFQEVLEPFYIFQVFSLIVWTCDSYYYYATCIVVMSALSLTSSVIQTRRNQKQLHDTVQGTDTVNVCRAKEDCYEKIESTQLVPGDIIEVPSFGCTMQCDAVLISGNVIVNESMLTGESVPVTKTPLPSTSLQMTYNAKEHAKHTLFCGTKVIQTRYYNNVKVRAVVIRIGYQTAKGELVRSIMFPKPVDFKLNRHIHKFVGFLAMMALVGFIYTVVLKTQRGVNWQSIVIKALDLITIVIPPALPAAMTIGVVFAQSRLRESEIFCISPRSINISGCINCVCFDKTGTLTEDDLSFSEIVPINNSLNQFGKPITDLVNDLECGPLLISLASCHSLTLIEGKMIGDPLDQKMFEATGWVLEEPEVNDSSKYDLLAPSVVRPKIDYENKEVGIIRQFPFSSSLQRMSVVVRQINGTRFELYAKGSPEMIASLCDPTTLPSDYTTTLQEYTEKGYRVLGLAYRPLTSLNYHKMQRASREDLEKNLTFLGLLVMGNMLKSETTDVIETLIRANIRTVMVTGDNMLTALSVARECSMIQPWHKVILLEIDPETVNADCPKLHWKFANAAHISDSVNYKLSALNEREKTHVAVSGKTFHILREHYPDVLKRVAVRGTVFARMSPEQKQFLIELLQEIGYYVGMCGDGANDCGALKAAHAGVSLSETEASVASPFTSKRPNISCIPTLIREGRASIVTAFGILKYMACYSLTQFISVIILYTFYSNLTDKEFLYIDLFLITLFVMLFGRNRAFKRLDRDPPPSSLIGLTPLASIVLQIILVTIMQVLSIIIVKQEPWYQPHVTNNNDDDLASHDNYALFASSVFQYITLAVVFSKGKPYRQPLYTNQLFLLSLIVMTILTVVLVVYPPAFIANFFELYMKHVTLEFRITMILLALAHFILAIFLEVIVVDYFLFKKSSHWFKSLNKSSESSSLYKTLDKETNKNTLWLPPYSFEKTIEKTDSNGMISSKDSLNTEKSTQSNTNLLQNGDHHFHGSYLQV
uniref:Cation-transporting ATPase n=1 Tax=Dermatophagoides pteronyssinus TaxID=6956 RepID=A0A6P6YJ34_DERPT|nr:probable cation-transporting ATPase 13A3 [Dermatophagoides pteronyssinus]XP_027204751.1 probable cation-transporting ATPase 13A3 [Dermatophagoides pteronyssinus]